MPESRSCVKPVIDIFAGIFLAIFLSCFWWMYFRCVGYPDGHWPNATPVWVMLWAAIPGFFGMMWLLFRVRILVQKIYPSARNVEKLYGVLVLIVWLTPVYLMKHLVQTR